MGLIQKLKSALGLDGARSPESGTDAPRDVDVTVEREPASESEDAVKGTDTAASRVGHSDEPETTGVDESNGDEVPIEEAEPGAADSTLDEFGEADDALETADESAAATETGEGTVETDAEPTVSSSEDVDESTGDAEEPSEATVEPTGTAEESVETAPESVEADEGAVETDEESVDASADEAPDVSDDPVTEISGIGPAYGQRLSDAGVDTVADLAAADADALEEATDISASRIEGWIDAAAEY